MSALLKIPEDFTGGAKPLDEFDFAVVASLIGATEAHIRAVVEVETSGAGFDKKGRPKMLFEPHIFYRELKDPQKRARAVAKGLAWRYWKRDYPSDSYPRLYQAILIDAEAALRSCSWGLGQIMGFNHMLAGYDTVQEMVVAFCADEENQLRGMVEFIKSANLDDELRRGEWSSFARGYNGSEYAKNAYHTKLQTAFRKWVSLLASEAANTTSAPVLVRPVLSVGSRGGSVKELQTLLLAHGFDPKGADGIYGNDTKEAVKRFQKSRSLVSDGITGRKTWTALLKKD